MRRCIKDCFSLLSEVIWTLQQPLRKRLLSLLTYQGRALLLEGGAPSHLSLGLTTRQDTSAWHQCWSHRAEMGELSETEGEETLYLTQRSFCITASLSITKQSKLSFEYTITYHKRAFSQGQDESTTLGLQTHPKYSVYQSV